jgi:AcrR family transcriptional regulator
MSNSLKDTIQAIALSQFSVKGFHGVSVRDIANEAGCSLPMVYYYFKNKEGLFHHVAYTEFMNLNDRLNQTIPSATDVETMYIQSLIARVNLSGYDKQVYKLALKTALGIHSMVDVQEELREWERSRFEFARTMVRTHFGLEDTTYANILSRVSSNILLRTIIYDEPLSDMEITKEIQAVFQLFRLAKNQS